MTPLDERFKLVINNVSKTFYDEHSGTKDVALVDISLKVSEGEFVCLVGPSGCGKTTFLRIIAGLEVADKGSIFIDGKKTSRPSPEKGMVFQEFALFPWRTVRKNVEFGLEFKKIPLSKRTEISDKFLKMVDLLEWANRYPFELSGGMKQRVAIARSLVNDPKILLMDEPFGSLDAQTRNILQFELLDIWRNTGKTIIYVSHNIDEAVFLAQRIVVLTARPGKIKNIHDVSLSYPRKRTSVKFQSIRRKILHEVSEEVLEKY